MYTNIALHIHKVATPQILFKSGAAILGNYPAYFPLVYNVKDSSTLQQTTYLQKIKVYIYIYLQYKLRHRNSPEECLTIDKCSRDQNFLKYSKLDIVLYLECVSNKLYLCTLLYNFIISLYILVFEKLKFSEICLPNMPDLFFSV